MVEALGLDRPEHGPPCCAARLPVVRAAKLVPDFVGKAVVGCRCVGCGCDEVQRGLWRSHWPCGGQKLALLDFQQAVVLLLQRPEPGMPCAGRELLCKSACKQGGADNNKDEQVSMTWDPMPETRYIPMQKGRAKSHPLGATVSASFLPALAFDAPFADETIPRVPSLTARMAASRRCSYIFRQTLQYGLLSETTILCVQHTLRLVISGRAGRGTPVAKSSHISRGNKPGL